MSQPLLMKSTVSIRSRTDIQKSVCKPPSRLKRWLLKFAAPAPGKIISDPLPQSQINSSLLSNLPLEIRLQIYDQVLCGFGKSQHVLLGEGLTHHRCVVSSSQIYLRTEPRMGVCIPEDTFVGSNDEWSLTGLLLSCKHM